MKKLLFATFFVVLSTVTFAQRRNHADTITKQTLFHRLSKLEKKQDLVNVSLNMKGSFNGNIDDNSQRYGFRMDQLRLQISGTITNWLSYNYRQRLNRSFDGSSSRDNTSGALDFAYINVKPFKNLSIIMGKQASAFGGYEFDHNPIDVYQYSNMVNTLVDFTTGVTFSYQVAPKHALSVQVAEAGTEMDKLGYKALIKADAPLAYSLYWAGSMFKNHWNTLWSVSYINDIKGYGRYMAGLGNQVNIGNKVSLEADFTYSREDVDVKGILSTADYRATNVNYISSALKINYRFVPKWNVFAKGMYEMAGFGDDSEYYALKKGIFGTYIGYVGGVEFYPMNENLRFFVTYAGASSKYEVERVKVNGFVNPEDHRISIGFIYKLPVF